tara:strand:- start:50 stop:247 length:198 start_codon:yes stop_codon:yes gene_type:complete
MSTFSRESIHDVEEVIVERRVVEAVGSDWDTLEIEIVDTDGNIKHLLLFAAEGKVMKYKREDNED